MVLSVRDETAAGESLHELSLDFLTERITVRELIRERVHHEVNGFNRRQNEEVFHSLVQPAEAEQVLNGPRIGFRLRDRHSVDWEAQFARALDGFANNSYFILVDDSQVESLDQELLIAPSTRVSFIKLVPLVGG